MMTISRSDNSIKHFEVVEGYGSPVEILNSEQMESRLLDDEKLVSHYGAGSLTVVWEKSLSSRRPDHVSKSAGFERIYPNRGVAEILSASGGVICFFARSN